jgi:hypothetical protein
VTPFQLWFHSRKQEEIAKGPNQASREGGEPRLCFQLPKITAQTKQCAPAHCHGEATCPGSAIVPEVFGGLVPSDASKPPGSDVGSQFGLEERIPGEQCPHSQKKITNMLLMVDPRLNRENHPKVCVLPMALSPEAVLSISCFSDAVFQSMK